MNVNFKLFNKGETVAVAVSGGEDSMALFHLLLAEKENIGCKIVCVNVEHGIRGESSLSDTAFVKDYCKAAKVPFYCYKVDAPAYSKTKGVGLEEAARILRYDAFEKLLAEKLADKVAVAHHASDNAETMLLNLLRGASLSGVFGMKQENGKIVRPFLSVTKAEILEYVKQNEIPFVTDETNQEDDNRRNFLRLNVLPKVKELFPEYERSLMRFAELCYDDDEYLSRLASELITYGEKEVFIKPNAEKAVFTRAVVKAFNYLGFVKDYTKKNVETVYGLVSNTTGKKTELPCGITAVREYDGIALYGGVSDGGTETETQIPFALGEFEVFGGTLKIERAYGKPDYKTALYFDMDKLPLGAVIRSRRFGDEFRRYGGMNKKLGDYLTDKKVPLKLRDSIPVIAYKKEVLVLGQIEISESVKVDKSTEVVLKLTYKKYAKEK